MRKLTAKEVEFELTIEPEDLEVRGNASAWGEPEDTEYANEIIDRLERDDVFAWCCILVKATWNGYTGFDSLGGCSFADGPIKRQQQEIEETARDHGMYDTALDDLNAAVARDVKHAKEIEAMLAESEEESASA